MEKEGISMSEEKKNLTEEERKELKEGLKEKIDEMSDEELDQVAGGSFNPFHLTEEQSKAADIIYKTGICPKCNQEVFYCLDKLRAITNHVKNCYK